MLCTAEVNKAFSKAHSVGNGLSHHNGHGSQKNRQEGKADPRKKKKELFSTIRNAARIFPKRNKACQRSYQRPRTAHIDANQKSTGILREAAEQNGSRNVADDLAGKRGDQHSSVGQKAGKQHPYRFHPGKIAGKGEKSGESGQQSPIYSFQRMPVQQPERQNNDRQTKDITEHTITNVLALRKDLALTAQRGYSIEYRENENEIISIGVPIYNSNGELLAAMTFISILSQITRK